MGGKKYSISPSSKGKGLFLRGKRFVDLMLGLAVFLLASNARAENVVLNFNNADIRSVIKFVSEFSHKNFLVDNRVKGRVTIISPSPIPAEDAYRVFLSILEVNGFTAVESGDLIKIIPMAEGKQKAIAVRLRKPDKREAELITQIIPLKHAQPQQLVALLRPLMSPQSNLAAYPPANMLVLTDVASNVYRLMQIIEALDVEEAVGVRILTLKFASADKMARMLASLFGAAGKGAQPQGSFKAIAYPPANALILVGSGALLHDALNVVERLDVPPQQSAGKLEVRYLKNADAEEVAKVLTNLISAAKSPAAKGASQKPVFAGEVNVVADPATNALLIIADPADREALGRIIDKLDIRRLQVLVEALIVEVSADAAKQFGIEWRAVGNIAQPGRRPFGGTAFANQAGTNINTIATNPFNAGSGLVVGLVDGTITFGGQTFANLGALLRALESTTDANVLSTPNILTMDNEEAEILVGQNVPFITGQTTTQAGVTNPFQTIQRQDVGITLKVTPQISEGDTVRLQIYQEVSNVTGGTADQGGFITNKRSIKTVVLANNDQIVVLGGLMRDDNSTTVQRVPCLGSIPIMGEAFKFTEVSKRKTNLMVFLRPHIIKSNRDITAITQGKYLDIKKLYERPIEKGTLIFPQPKKRLPQDLSPIARPQQAEKAKKGTPKAP